MVMEAPENKSQENRSLVKFNFNGGLFSSPLLSGASLTIFVADFY